MKTFLHVGCGPENKSRLKGFNSVEWREIRFDIDPSVNPDIEGTLTDMDAVATGSVDAVFSSHNIEHVFPHEVHTVLLEFHRVLKEDGIVVLTCPDLRSVCQAVVSDRLLEPLYESPMGPIAPIDILYGHRDSVADGKISASGANVSGSIGREGLVKVSINGAYANGQISGNSGSGKWNGASAGIPCSGRWQASRF